MCVEIARKKQPLARLFLGIYYDGQAFEIGVKTATAKEMKAVFDKYGQDRGAVYCAIYPAITSHTAGTSSPSFQLATPLTPWLCITWSFTATESRSSSQH